MRYLRNKKDGFIYEWNDILARNVLCEEVTEEQAFPERFIKAEMIEAVQEIRRKRKSTLDLSTDLGEPRVYTAPELAQEAARGFPE